MDVIHAAMAGCALLLGAVQLWGRKFGPRHRWLGRGYFVAMALTALSSFTQTSMTGGYSFLHLLAVVVLATLAQNIWYLRRGNYIGHAYSMIWLYGGVVTAGVLAADRHLLNMPTPLTVAVLCAVWLAIWRISERYRRQFTRRFA